MMKNFKAAIVAAGAILLFTASSAFAKTITYTQTGALIVGGSWSGAGTSLDTFSLGTPNGNVKWNKAVFTRTGGNDIFEVGAPGSAQGTGKIFVGGSGTAGNQFSSSDGGVPSEAAGSTTTSGTVNNTVSATLVGYRLVMAGPGTGGETISYRVDLFNGAVQVAVANVTSTVNTDHTVTTITTISDNIPVPPAVWTGVAMLGGMMLLVRRRNRRILA